MSERSLSEFKCHHDVMLSRAVAALAETKADLARVTAERDRLIERWPDDEGNGGKPVKDWTDVNGKWRAYAMRNEHLDQFDTRTAAVRFAAGLDAD